MKSNRKKLFGKITYVFMVFILLQSLFVPSFALAAPDGTPPVVESVEVGPNEVSAGGIVEIKAKVVDEKSGVKSASLFFDSPSENQIGVVSLEYNESTGLWEGNYKVEPFTEAGKWEFRSIRVIDYAGNDKHYNASSLENADELYFNVVNEEGDGDAPLVENLKVSPIEVGVGGEVTIEAKVIDENTGVKSASFFFDSPSKHQIAVVSLKYNESTELWKGNYTIESFTEAGKWTFRAIRVIDNAGNDKHYNASSIKNADSLDFKVENENGDGNPPSVESLKVSPNEVGAGEQIFIEAQVIDENSGVKTASFFFDSPSKNQIAVVSLEYNELTGLWEGYHPVVSFAEIGRWTFRSIHVGDYAGNEKAYNARNLNDLINLDFIVNPELNINDPSSPYFITKHNETWNNKVIDKDIYIGPDSILTIDGNVEITGDVYVYGALRSYGDLTINGTLNAKNIRYGYGGSLNNGSAQIIRGTNNISSTKVSNQPYEIPFEIYSENLSNETDHIEIEGKTLPFLDVFVKEEQVSMNNRGEFDTKVEGVTENKITFEIFDVFGHKMEESVTVKDVIAPERISEFNVTEISPDSITVNWNKVNDSDVGNYSLFINNEKINAVESDVTTYTISDLKQDTIYNLSIAAVDTSGNVGEQTTIEAITNVKAPAVNEVTDQDEVLTGKSSSNAIIKVQTEEKEIGSGQVETDGDFTVTIPQQPGDTKLDIIAIGKSGLESEITSIIVEDTIAPEAPILNEVTDQSIVLTGKAEADSLVSAKVSDEEIGKSTAELNGTFEIEIAKQSAGTEITVTATDEAGNQSQGSKIVVIDVTAPEAPELNEVTDQTTTLTGEAEVGSEVSAKVSDEEIGNATTDSKGIFEIEIAKQSAGTEIWVTATDKAGNESEISKVIVNDITPPEAPVIDEVTDQSTMLTGKAEAGSQVMAKVSDEEIGKSTAELNGTFEIEIAKQSAGTEITVTATDNAGNQSQGSKIVVIDVTAPEAPELNEVTDQSRTLTGKAEAGSKVSAKVASKEIGNATAKSDGTFEIKIERQKIGAEIAVTATDKAGNKSDPSKVVVIDVTPPKAPILDEITDKSLALTGNAEPGSQVIAKVSDKEIGKTTAESDGTFEIEIVKQSAGTEIIVTATDRAGNQSEGSEIVVIDVTAPKAPELNEVTDQSTTLTGKAEAESEVAAQVSGKEIGTTSAKSDGTFEMEIPKQTAGTEISVTATDTSGNVSEISKTTVLDKTAPTAPVVEEVTVHSITLTGTAEANSTISAKVGGKEIGSTTAESNGTFEMNIAKQSAGTEILITATDEAGNESEATKLTVKAQLDRIQGDIRYDTAIEVSRNGWDSAETVIIVRGDEFADALAGVPLAHKLDAPILMTPSNKLWDNTLTEIKRLGAKNAVILGGEVAVSKSVAAELEKSSLDVRRIDGSSRFETAALIAEELTPDGSDKVVVANGMDFPDALSVASHAAKEGLPILLTMDDRLPVSTETQIKELGIKETIVVGGKNVITEKIKAALPKSKRLGGNDRYETNVAIAEHFGVDSKHLYVATGQNYADALTGAVLAAKNDSTILLVHHRVPASVSNYLNYQQADSLSIFGGEVAVSAEIEAALKELLQ